MSRESDNSLSAFQAPRILPLPPGSTRSADLLRRIRLWHFGTSSPPPRSCSSSCSSCDTSVPVPPVIRAAPKVRTFQATNAVNGWMRLIFVLAWYFTRHLPDARAPYAPWIYQRLVTGVPFSLWGDTSGSYGCSLIHLIILHFSYGVLCLSSSCPNFPGISFWLFLGGRGSDSGCYDCTRFSLGFSFQTESRAPAASVALGEFKAQRSQKSTQKSSVIFGTSSWQVLPLWSLELFIRKKTCFCWPTPRFFL